MNWRILAYVKSRLLALFFVLAAVGMARLLSQAGEQPAEEASYAPDGRMLRPDNYREWVWLSSGLGMSYNPSSSSSSSEHPPFDNVFANPTAYRAFVRTGIWPDKTVLILEVRASVDKGSINQSGHFQGELIEVEAHVKDERRFPGKWAFFGFGGTAKTAAVIPPAASCYTCHAQHGAVDTTFVQFYPTLLTIAKDKGTAR